MTVATEKYANTAQSTLAGSIASDDTTLTVASAAGFPTSGKFRLRIDSEYLLCTAVSGATFTVTRGAEGSTAVSHSTGSAVTHVITAAGSLNNPLAMTAAFDMPYLDANGNQARLAANPSVTMKLIGSQGAGTNPTAPQLVDPATLSVSHAMAAAGLDASGFLGQALLSNGPDSSPTMQQIRNPKAFSGAAFPNQIVSGTSFGATAGKLRTTELVVISKGEHLFDMPDWSGTGKNLLCFGDTIKLANDVLFTAYSKQESEGVGDGTSIIEAKYSYDLGATWSAPVTMASAATYGVTANLEEPTLFQTSKGRTVMTFAVLAVVATNTWKLYLQWTDDPFATTGWSTPVQVGDSLFTATQIIMSHHAIDLPDGSVLYFPYGATVASPTNRSTSCCTLTFDGSNNPSFTRRSLVFDGPADGKSYIEVGGCIRPDGSILVVCRSIDDATTIFKSSTDGGTTWSAIGSQIISGNGKPVLLTLSNGAMVLLNRDGNAAGESSIWVCRDGSGMNATSWIGPQYFDWRHYLYRYGAIFETAPNVIGCTFGASVGIGSSLADWIFTTFTDGNARTPHGSFIARDVQCNDSASHRQIVPVGGRVAPIVQYPASNALVTLADAIAAITDLRTQLTAAQSCHIFAGNGVWHPMNSGLVCGMWEPWRTPITVNDWTDTFVNADSGTVVASATRTNGEAIVPTQLVGTWGTTSNQGKLVTASGGNGILYWDFGTGNGTYTIHQIYNNTASIIIPFRLTDASNYLFFVASTGGNYTLSKFVAGSGTTLATSVTSAPTNGNKVAVKIVMNADNIQIFVDNNVSGSTPVYPASPQINVTLSGGDFTLFPITKTKHGVRCATANTTLYTLVNLHQDLNYTDGTEVIGEIPEFSGGAIGGTPIGSIIQTTAGRKVVLARDPMLFNNRSFAYQSGAGLGLTLENLATAAFTAQSGPFTFIWAGMPTQAGGTRTLMRGVGANTPRISLAGTTRIISILATSGAALPAFPAYPDGPMIIRAFFDTTNNTGTIYRNGSTRIATGALSTIGTITQIMMGDPGGGMLQYNAHVAFYAGGTPAQHQAFAVEHERMIADGFKIEAWNPR